MNFDGPFWTKLLLVRLEPASFSVIQKHKRWRMLQQKWVKNWNTNKKNIKSHS